MSAHAFDQACCSGRHRPHGRPLPDDSGITRATCRDCGAPLVRTLKTRRWYPSVVFR